MPRRYILPFLHFEPIDPLIRSYFSPFNLVLQSFSLLDDDKLKEAFPDVVKLVNTNPEKLVERARTTSLALKSLFILKLVIFPPLFDSELRKEAEEGVGLGFSLLIARVLQYCVLRTSGRSIKNAFPLFVKDYCYQRGLFSSHSRH